MDNLKFYLEISSTKIVESDNYHPRENSPVLRGVAPAPVALADPVARAGLHVVGGIAAALALVATAVVARPTLVAPEMNDLH